MRGEEENKNESDEKLRKKKKIGKREMKGIVKSHDASPL